MALLYGIKAIHQSTANNKPHIFGHNTARSAANDTLVEIWNAATDTGIKWALDLDGKMYSNALTAGDLVYSVTGGITNLRRLDSLAIGTAGQFLAVNSGATAPEWTSTLPSPLILDQAAADTVILSLRSSDVTTVLTTITTPDVTTSAFAAFAKANADEGGLKLLSLAEDAAVSPATVLESWGGTATSVKSTSGRALVEVYVTEHDGANALADITADGNVFGVRGRVGAADVMLWLVDEDGDTWQSGDITCTNIAATVTTATQNSITTMTGLVTVGTIATGVWNGTAINGTYIDEASVDHDLLLNFVAGEHFLQSAITTVGTIGTGVWQGSSIATGFTDAKVVSVTGGTGIDSTGGANPDITFDASELALGGTLVAGDHLVAANAAVSNRQVISSIPLSIFNNDSGFTSNVGDITRVNITAGNGLTGNVDTTSGDHTQTINAVGTTNRITVTAGAIDIASTYVGQTTITTLGTISTGTWSGTTISSVTEAAVTTHQAAINHDALSNFLATEHFIQSAITATGAVNSGTITSGHGSIDIGTSTLSVGVVVASGTGDSSFVGNVGIGVTSPVPRFHVGGTLSGATPPDVVGFRNAITITMTSGAANVLGAHLDGSIVLDSGVTASEACQLKISEPNISGAGTTNTAACLIVFGIPTEGSTQNFAIIASGGVSQFHSMVFGNPTGGPKGGGTLNLGGDVFKNDTAYTNPDYVFELHWLGHTLPATTARAGYKWMPLDDVEIFTKKHYHLPGIHRESMGAFERGDMALEHVERLYLHAFDHEDRIANLEHENADLRDKVAELAA